MENMYFLQPEKVAFVFFAFRIIQFWEKAIYFKSLMKKFSSSYFPRI